jgi:hypothetical protein
MYIMDCFIDDRARREREITPQRQNDEFQKEGREEREMKKPTSAMFTHTYPTCLGAKTPHPFPCFGCSL